MFFINAVDVWKTVGDGHEGTLVFYLYHFTISLQNVFFYNKNLIVL